MYERLSEDRQEFIAEVGKLDGVLNHLATASKAMREFEPRVRQAMEESLRGATPKVVQVVLNAAGDLKDPGYGLVASGILVETVLRRRRSGRIGKIESSWANGYWGRGDSWVTDHPIDDADVFVDGF